MEDAHQVCGRCGRRLKSPISIKRGFGPVCWQKKQHNKAQQQKLFGAGKSGCLFLILLLASVLVIRVYAPISPYADDIYEMHEHFRSIDKAETHGEELEKFLTHLSLRESSGDWTLYNPWGYIGLFQIGSAARIDVGYGHITFQDFTNNPGIFPPQNQRDAVKRLIKLNIDRMRPYTDHYHLLLFEVIEVGGIKITPSGLIAGAHLAGPFNMKRFIETDGKHDPRDAYGTFLSDYVKEFSGYEIQIELIK